MSKDSNDKPLVTLTRKTAVLMAIALVIAGSIPASIVTLVLGPKVNQNAEVAHKSAHLSNATIEALVKICEQNRVPLQERFSFELEQSLQQNIKQLQEAFPQFPPKQIKNNIKGERNNLRDLLTTYDPSKCADQLPQPTTPEE